MFLTTGKISGSMKMIRNIIRSIVFCILEVFATSALYAQYDAQLSQYMLHPTGFNPAAVGNTGMLDISGQHRMQWIGMPNAGSTTIFNVDAPFRLGNSKHGAGVSFTNDQVGLFVNQSVHLQYSTGFNIGKGKLNVGIKAGFLSIGFHGDSIRGTDVGEYYDLPSDIVIPKTMSEGIGFDMGVGAWFTQERFYAGLSFSHLNQPVIDWDDEHQYKPAGTVYLTGGYAHPLRNPDFVLKPSFYLKTDFSLLQCDISGLLNYKDLYWGGLSYRWGDAVVILAGLNIAAGLSIGYSYDLPASQVIRASWGSHELFLSYAFEIDRGNSSRRKKFKSIRIL